MHRRSTTKESPQRSALQYLDVDTIEKILQLNGLEAAGRLSSTCMELNSSCAPLLSRLHALTEYPICLRAKDCFGAESRVHLRWTDMGLAQIGDTGLQILVRACASGALAKCSHLYLNHSGIGDDGMRALANACGRGALSNLVRLSLIGNRIGDAGIEVLASACAHRRALPALWDLWLSGNLIACAGASALAAACTDGALSQLCSLTLSQNNINDRGVSAFASALSRDALPRLGELGIDERHAVLQEACAARGITLSTLQERLPPPGKLNDRLSLTDEEADEESDLEGFDQIGYQATVDLFVV